MQQIVFLETKAFSHTVKELQKDKSCKKTNVLVKILEELVEKVGTVSLTHFFSYEGMRFYKKRLRHPCSVGGRSGGARLVFGTLKEEGRLTVVFVTIYFKSEKESITENEVLEALASGLERSQAQELISQITTAKVNRFLESLTNK